MRRRIAWTVAVAGIVGAAGRWAVATRINDDWALLVVNVVGCGLIGWALAHAGRSQAQGHPRPGSRGTPGSPAAPSPWLAAGFCGALTSMSTLALQLARLLDDGRVGSAGAWLGLTVAACTAAFIAGRAAVLVQRTRP
ncbi:fluoride efflux transporter FluC [Candidatus Poriferisodalis sp.]|uniref:fluoride efflux transporter FluC n=1 Tax=Candidatus Poriferisodalis sp. TaxID=3101277 RepID=UPI003B02A313